MKAVCEHVFVCMYAWEVHIKNNWMNKRVSVLHFKDNINTRFFYMLLYAHTHTHDLCVFWEMSIQH